LQLLLTLTFSLQLADRPLSFHFHLTFLLSQWYQHKQQQQQRQLGKLFLFCGTKKSHNIFPRINKLKIISYQLLILAGQDPFVSFQLTDVNVETIGPLQKSSFTFRYHRFRLKCFWKNKLKIILNPATNDIIQLELLSHHLNANGKKTNSSRWSFDLNWLSWAIQSTCTLYTIPNCCTVEEESLVEMRERKNKTSCREREGGKSGRVTNTHTTWKERKKKLNSSRHFPLAPPDTAGRHTAFNGHPPKNSRRKPSAANKTIVVAPGIYFSFKFLKKPNLN
jgi:hypothetical protein